MTEEEKALCKNAITEYKTIHPVVELGDIYHLLSTYHKQGVASLTYVAPEKDKAAFYWWKTEDFCNQHLPRVKMAGLCADKQYKVLSAAFRKMKKFIFSVVFLTVIRWIVIIFNRNTNNLPYNIK